MKLENFEQEYLKEIEDLKKAEFSNSYNGEFKVPGYNLFYTKAFSIAFAVPAMVVAFAFFLSPGTSVSSKDLALLEESNNRILAEINSFDKYEGNK